MDYTCRDLKKLALQIIKDKVFLISVQPNLSLYLNEHKGNHRLTIVGLWGALNTIWTDAWNWRFDHAFGWIAKYVSHTQMHMADNSLCYLTKRLGRSSTGEKVAMEDMCQLPKGWLDINYGNSYMRIVKDIFNVYNECCQFLWNYVVLIDYRHNNMHLKNCLYVNHETAIYVWLRPTIC